MRHLLITTLAVGAIGFSGPAAANGFNLPPLTLTPIGTYESGIFDESAAEIVAFDPRTDRAFVVNANDATVDVLDLSDPSNPVKADSIDVTQAGASLGAANSVAVARGILAVAIERDPKQADGIVAFYATNSLALLGTADVGALPDMLTFTADGNTVLVANEGEPSDDYAVDPVGSVSIIDLSRGVGKASVRTAGFERFNNKKDKLIAQGVRIFGPGASVAQDLEPEYITVEKDGKRAYVALQEANALAVLDVRQAKIKRIIALGTKDHSEPGNELDASNRDDAINIRSWPVLGMYQPDAIASYQRNGRTYIVTANEGDSRDYDGFSEEDRVGDLPLDPNVFPDAAALQLDENLGRLKTTVVNGDTDGDELYEEIYAYGARSFSIWSPQGKLIFDSGNEFESITASLLPDDFNSTNDENDSFDNRSDDKGPEPEGLALGELFGRTYAFIGLERIGGIMVYDITDPRAPVFQSYVNNRDFSAADVSQGGAGDLGPEGLTFVPWWQSPNWRPLLIVGNEVSGTTTVFQIGFPQ
ncbi:MAG: choice-of-anchor I family protein [Gammaproteobacteria bacterium]